MAEDEEDEEDEYGGDRLLEERGWPEEEEELGWL